MNEVIDNTLAMIEVINDLPAQILASMTPLEIAAEIISAVSTLADMAYNAGQVVYDLANGTLGWHNLFNFIPFGSVILRHFDFNFFRHWDGEGGNHLDNVPRIPDPRVIGDSNFDDLVGELRNNNVRFSEDGIVKITRGFDGKIYWLETGNSATGLIHIVGGHATDFRKAFQLNTPEEIANFITLTINSSTPVSRTVNSRGIELIYELPDVGQQLLVAVGTNGYIVSAYPRRIRTS